MSFDFGAGTPPNMPPQQPAGSEPGGPGYPSPPSSQMTPIPAEQNPQPITGRNFVTVVLVVLAFAGGWLGNTAFNRASGTQPPPGDTKYADDIWTAWNIINNNYVDPSAFNKQQATYAMIDAMVNSLGDTGHSRFLTPQEVAQENQAINNASFVGIGVVLQQMPNSSGQTITIVESTIPGSPAQGATFPGIQQKGLLPGDQIVAVGGQDVTTASIDTLSSLIRGPKGTPVTITVKRPGIASPITTTIVRAEIQDPLATEDYFSQDHIGYVALDSFSSGAGDKLTATLKTLQADGATSLIFDLRGNGGGLVDEAMNVAADFLPQGAPVVVVKSRDGSEQTMQVGSSGLHLTMPMVLLVDNGTASASEIVTGALQDDRSIPVIGQRTFGTDTVLETFNLPDGSAVLLGTQQYLTPKLRQFRPGQGLVPSEQVALPPNGYPLSPSIISESNLSEADILAGKGLADDTQLIAAIHAIDSGQAK
jgi:carboxyl-terminal processing protease